MTGIRVVMRRYFREFFKERGKILLSILPVLASILTPFLVESFHLQVLAVIGFTAFYLVQSISGVYVQEKEKKTMESLLSAPTTIRELVLGAVLFQLCIFAVQIAASLVVQAFLNQLLGNADNLNTLQFLVLVVCWAVTLLFLTVRGLLCSMLSDNLPAVSQKNSSWAYGVILYLTVCLTLLEIGYADLYYFFMLSYSFVLILAVVYQLRYSLNNITRERVLMGEQHRRRVRVSNQFRSEKKERRGGSPSAVSCIVRHEWKIARSYSFLRKHFMMMILLPGIALVAVYSKGMGLDHKLPIIAAILLALRIPMNLISISIGGEKAYKTFESLLSTPISTRAMFLGKILPSVLVAGVVLLGSACGLLLSENMIRIYILGEYGFTGFTLSGLILLVGDGLLVTVLMVFISGYFALMSKTPRVGLWISVLMSCVLALPHCAILYWAENPLFAAVLYFIILLAINVLCFTVVLRKVDRRVLLGRI